VVSLSEPTSRPDHPHANPPPPLRLLRSYKFGLEYFNGAFITLANERFPKEVRYRNVGVLTGTNAAMQCVGSILIAPLMKRFPTRTVLSYAVLVFGLISMTLLIADAATGGKPKLMNGGKTKYGSWSPNGLFPIYIISGVAYGMVELIRRVIPRNIVAGDVQRVSPGLSSRSDETRCC
jgi:MFS family permease